MTQSERLGLDPQYIARERREDTGPETSAGTVMDAGRREFFASHIEIAVFRERAQEIDGAVDFRSLRRCRIARRFVSPSLPRLEQETHHHASQDTPQLRGLTKSTSVQWPEHRCHDSGGCTPPGRRDSS